MGMTRMKTGMSKAELHPLSGLVQMTVCFPAASGGKEEELV